MGLRTRLGKVYRVLIRPIVLIRDRRWEKQLQKRLKADDFSIICSNCIGGTIYHRLHKKFLSPTVNMFIEDRDFVRFAKNLRHYLSCDLKFEPQAAGECPYAWADDVRIKFVHYDTAEEARECWYRRRERVNYDNPYFIMFDIGETRYEDLLEFGKLKCRNRVCLSDREHPDLDYVVTLKKGPHDSNKHFMSRNLLMRTRYEDQWDFVGWLNEGAAGQKMFPEWYEDACRDIEALLHPEKAGNVSGGRRYSLNVNRIIEERERLEDWIETHSSTTFQMDLMDRIAEKKLPPVKFYKSAMIDRKLFSAIKNNPDYMPRKDTAVSCCLALHLSLDEAEHLLSKAGYALSRSRRWDLIIDYCLHHQIYDIDTVNTLLDHFGEKTIGC